MIRFNGKEYIGCFYVYFELIKVEMIKMIYMVYGWF